MGIAEDRLTAEVAWRGRSRWVRAGIAVLVLLVAFFLVVALQGGDDDSGGGAPLNAIAQAAEKTKGEPGGRVSMRAVLKTPGSEPLPMRGQMVYDDEDRTRALITAKEPDSGKAFQLHMVSEGSTVYMSSSRFGSLPDDKKWIGLDLGFALEQGESLAPGNPDAEGELELLEGVSDDIRKLGEEEVRGVPTTHYSGTIPVARQAERMRKLGADETAGRFEEDGSPAKVEVWIDAKDLVRRMRVVQSTPQLEDGTITTTDMRMDFFDFGIEPKIEVPDSSEVFDATAQTEEALEDH